MRPRRVIECRLQANHTRQPQDAKVERLDQTTEIAEQSAIGRRLLKVTAIVSHSAAKRFCSLEGFLRMFQLAALGSFVLCVLLTVAEPLRTQQRDSTKPNVSRPVSPIKQTLSPLHAFLGIDPVTGEFKPPNAPPPRTAPGPVASCPPGTPSDPDPLPADVPLADMPLGSTTLEDVRAAMVKAIENGDDDALASAILKVPGGVGYDRLMALGAQYAWIGYLLLLYPLGIVLSELFSAWVRRKENAGSEGDRRFYSRQLRRSVLMTLCTMGSITLVWWAGENSFWWDQPARLIVAVVALGLFAFIAAALRLINRRAAARYSLAIIQDLRRQHAALQGEIEELRQRLQRSAVADAV
jgi:hypothetical protein